jgi:tetraacyldisaccharide 4'-kinase
VIRAAAAWLERVWYPSAGGAAPPLALRLASRVYGRAVRRRAAAAERDASGALRLPVPCVSVGNLSVGGTGKTPLAAWIAGELAALGERPAIVSRGYGGRAPGPERVPADGGAATARRFGDEPALLAAQLPGVPVVVGRDRHAAGMLAVRACGATVVVADDAFQHRRLARDLDVAVVDATRGMGNGWLLPAGPLREPAAGLARAGVVVVNRVGEAGSPEGVLRAVAALAPRAAVVSADLAFAGLRDARSGASANLAPGTPVFGFCGIANPDSFRRTLERQGLRVVGWERFPDHHRYRGAELARLARAAAAGGAAAAVTTAKDAVRVGAWEGPLPLYRAEVKLAIISGREQLWEALKTLAAGPRG